MCVHCSDTPMLPMHIYVEELTTLISAFTYKWIHIEHIKQSLLEKKCQQKCKFYNTILYDKDYKCHAFLNTNNK